MDMNNGFIMCSYRWSRHLEPKLGATPGDRPVWYEVVNMDDRGWWAPLYALGWRSRNHGDVALCPVCAADAQEGNGPP